MTHLRVGEQRPTLREVLDKIRRQEGLKERLWQKLRGPNWKQILKDLWQKSTWLQWIQLMQWIWQKAAKRPVSSTPIYPHEISLHYWDNTAPTTRSSQESFTSPGPLHDNSKYSPLDWDVQSRQEGNVTAYRMPFADTCNNNNMNDPLAYLDAYDSSYEEESA